MCGRAGVQACTTPGLKEAHMSGDARSGGHTAVPSACARWRSSFFVMRDFCQPKADGPSAEGLSCPGLNRTAFWRKLLGGEIPFLV